MAGLGAFGVLRALQAKTFGLLVFIHKRIGKHLILDQKSALQWETTDK